MNIYVTISDINLLALFKSANLHSTPNRSKISLCTRTLLTSAIATIKHCLPLLAPRVLVQHARTDGAPVRARRRRRVNRRDSSDEDGE